MDAVTAVSNSVAEFVRIGTLWGTPSEVSRLRLRGFRGAKILHGVGHRGHEPQPNLKCPCKIGQTAIPAGVMVALLILDQSVEVRILGGELR